MATEFTATVKSSTGDYTSLSAAEAGLQNDITVATIKVFSISANIGVIAAGDNVVGNTSLATGVCVLVNAALNQILIKTIAVSTFQSGEVVQKVADATKQVTLSNVGDSPIIGIACYSFQDTTAVTINGWTTSATNYIRVYTPSGERHDGKRNTSKYRLEVNSGTADTQVLSINEEYVRVEGLQTQMTLSGSPTIYSIGINVILAGASDVRIENNIINLVKGANNTQYLSGVEFTNTSASARLKLSNNIVYDWIAGTVESRGIQFDGGTNGSAIYAHNNTSQNCQIGFSNGVGAGVTFLAKNCGAASCTTGFSTNITQTTCSSTAPTFVNAGADDFHLQSSDTTWKDAGTDLSADANYPITLDIDGSTRTGTWDIGADEYVAAGGSTFGPIIKGGSILRGGLIRGGRLVTC